MTELKLIIAGGRDFNDYERLSRVVTELATLPDMYGPYAVSIVSGMARGADTLGYRFAVENNIKVYGYSADWDKHGKSAGFVRNKEMGDFSDVLLAFWDSQSRGTKHMIDYMRSLGKPVHIVAY